MGARVSDFCLSIAAIYYYNQTYTKQIFQITLINTPVHNPLLPNKHHPPSKVYNCIKEERIFPFFYFLLFFHIHFFLLKRRGLSSVLEFQLASQQQERPVRGHKRKRSIVQDSFDRLRQQRRSFGLAGSPTVMMGTTPSMSISTANTSHYPNSSSINQNLRNNLTKMTTATLPTIKKQQQQQQLQSRINFNNNNTSNNNSVTIATGDTNTSTSICNSRKRSMDTATQTEDGSPPTKARIVGSPLAAGSYDIVHDGQACMFKMKIDGRGSIAALCYLPTRVQNLIEFYHTEIPIGYRDMGLGDLLVKRAFEWAEERKALIIATCPFVRRYLARHPYSNVVRTEQEAIERLIK